MPEGDPENPDDGLPEDQDEDCAEPQDVLRKPVEALELKFDPKIVRETFHQFSQRHLMPIKTILP